MLFLSEKLQRNKRFLLYLVDQNYQIKTHIFNVVSQLLPLLLADEGHGAVVGVVIVAEGGGGREGQKHGKSQHGLGSRENTF